MVGWLNLVLVLVFCVLAILFAMTNQTVVTVQIPGGWGFSDTPLFVVAFIPLFFGFFLGAFSLWGGHLKKNKRILSLVRKNQRLEEELTNLRNQPLENDLQL